MRLTEMLKRWTVCTAVLCSVSEVAYAQRQPYDGFAQEYFFGRLYSSRAEAMGHCFVSLDGDASSINFNPASIANLDGVEISGASATPYYLNEDAQKYAFNVASRVSRKIAVGFSLDALDYNTQSYITDIEGNITDSFENIISTNKVAFAYRPESTFMLGGSLGLSTYEIAGFQANSVQFNFSVLKKFEFTRFRNNQSINLATGFRNPIGSEVNFEIDSVLTVAIGLPIIMQSGISYYYSSEEKIRNLTTHKMILALEYQTLFNERNVFNKYSTGLEISLLEILHLRCGYYTEILNTFNNLANLERLQAMTYGLGITLPINKLTDIPIQLSVDYCSLPQPSYTANQNWENFQSITGSIRYDLFEN